MWVTVASLDRILEPDLGLSCTSHWLGGRLLEVDEKVKKKKMYSIA